MREIDQGRFSPVYLVFGERFLCQEAADRLIRHLLPDEGKRLQQLKQIDGEQEDPAQTISLLRTYNLFAGRQVFRVMDSRLFTAKETAQTLWAQLCQAHAAKEERKAERLLGRFLQAAGVTSEEAGELASLEEERWQELFGFARPREDLSWLRELAPVQRAGVNGQRDAAALLMEALQSGLPPGNILVLVAEGVDRRKRLFKFIEEQGAIIDLSIDGGSSAAARRDQEELLKTLVEETLAGLGKRLEPRALPALLERVGFHPVAVVMEAEKLALHAGAQPVVLLEDVDELLGRTREEALFALTEAVADRDAGTALLVLSRLQEGQVHALAIVAGMRNFLKKLLLARALQGKHAPAYACGLSFPVFQKGYLPALKTGCAEWPPSLGGHPYVVYKIFRQAENFSLVFLRQALAALLDTEYRLKSSRLSERLILQHYFFQLLLAQTDWPGIMPREGCRS